MKLMATFAALAAFSAAATAEAAVFSLNTGVANWQVSQTAGASNNGAALNTTSNASVLTGGLPGTWVLPPAGSAWVGQRVNDGQFQSGANDDGASDGTYVYTLSWDAGAGGNFSFSFAGDNTFSSLTVIQGGNTLYDFTSNANDFSSLISTGVVNFSGLGPVLVTATIVNAVLPGQTRNPSGFLVSGTANVVDENVVPLPAAAALLPFGLAFIAAAARKKKSA